jgi:hypothetical protein
MPARFDPSPCLYKALHLLPRPPFLFSLRTSPDRRNSSSDLRGICELVWPISPPPVSPRPPHLLYLLRHILAHLLILSKCSNPQPNELIDPHPKLTATVSPPAVTPRHQRKQSMKPSMPSNSSCCSDPRPHLRHCQRHLEASPASTSSRNLAGGQP